MAAYCKYHRKPLSEVSEAEQDECFAFALCTDCEYCVDDSEVDDDGTP